MATFSFEYATLWHSKTQPIAGFATYRHNLPDLYNPPKATLTPLYSLLMEQRQLLLPKRAPASWQDPDVLWKEVEAQEKRVEAQLGWQLRVNLPVHYTPTQQMALLTEYARTYFLSQDLMVDLALPLSLPHQGSLLITARSFTTAGWGNKKSKEWPMKAKLMEWRDGWAKSIHAISVH